MSDYHANEENRPGIELVLINRESLEQEANTISASTLHINKEMINKVTNTC